MLELINVYYVMLSQIQILFSAETGHGGLSDIAIDDIVIRNDAICKG